MYITVCSPSSPVSSEWGEVFIIGGDTQSRVPEQLPQQSDMLMAAPHGSRYSGYVCVWSN